MKVRCFKAFILFILIIFYNKINAQQLFINEVLSSNTHVNYDPDFGAFSDWIEIINSSASVIDISGYYLSDDSTDLKKWEIPANTFINIGECLLFWADGENLIHGQVINHEFTNEVEITVQNFHLNFRISDEGDHVFLVSPLGIIVDQLIVPDLSRNISYGRESAQPQNLNYFGSPTPGVPNGINGSPTQTTTDSLVFSIIGGKYDNTTTLSISVADIGAEIRYTTDGSIPINTSSLYTAPIDILFSQTIRARAFKTGLLPGPIKSETYIIQKPTTLPIVSFSTDHNNLWGFDFGIYQNNLKNREIPIHLEYFDSSGIKQFKIDAGAELFGSQIFALDQKPFSINLRGKYGVKQLNYPLFGQDGVQSFSDFVLRNGGNDNAFTMFRDGLGAVVVDGEIDIDNQAYQPAVLYVNGDYWGIYNIREKLNSSYISSHHSVNENRLDYIEDSLDIREGDANHYNRMIDFVSNNDMSLDINYKYICNMIEKDEFMDYMIYKIFAGYKQWQVNNRYWREKKHDGKWRWIVFDMEHAFAGPGGDSYLENSLEKALNGNPGISSWSIILFQKLMNNITFRDEFIQRTALYTSTVFEKERLEHIIDSLSGNIASEMDQHIIRWGIPVNKFVWTGNVNYMKQFVQNRKPYLFDHYMSEFVISDTSKLIINSTIGGMILLAGVPLKEDTFNATFFNDITIELIALPEPGYKFSSWNGNNFNDSIKVVLSGDSTINVEFIQDASNLIPDTIQGQFIVSGIDSIWYAAGDIIVPTSDTLIIEEGVKILLSENACIIVYGTCLINGSSESPVIFDINKFNSKKEIRKLKWGAIIADNADTALVIKNCILNNASNGKNKDLFKSAISTRNTNVVLYNVTIPETDNPVYCYKGRVTISNCYFHSESVCDLINLRACDSAIISNCILKGNYAVDADGVDLDSVTNSLVQGNEVFGFYGYNSDGIDLGEGCEDITISENLIYACNDKGISVGQGSNVIAIDNFILNCGQGFGIKDSFSTASIIQNTFYNCDIGVACFEKNENKGGGTAQINSSLFYTEIGESYFLDSLSEITFKYSLSLNDSLPGQNNYINDPLFVNSPTNDFRYLSASPCIDTGDPLLLDLDSSRADIGANSDLSTLLNYPIIISEINISSPSRINSGDWVEIYNYSDSTIEMSGWMMKDKNDDNEFIFPDSVFLQGKNYLLVCQNTKSLIDNMSVSNNVIGDFNFGLSSNNETLKLLNSDGSQIYTTNYKGNDPKLIMACGFGASLEKYTYSDSSEYGSFWYASHIPGGTPGQTNSVATTTTGIVINELMAKNTSSIQDEFGEFDDWLELYNLNTNEKNINGLYLSQDTASFSLNPIPLYAEAEGTLEGNSFKLLWADDDLEQGPFHLGFKLNSLGEDLFLLQLIENKIHVIDHVSYGLQNADISSGYFPDGTGEWQKLEPTPELPNLLVYIKEKTEDIELLLFPVPVHEKLTMLFSKPPNSKVKLEIVDIHGKSVKTKEIEEGINDIITLDVSNLMSGIYIVKIWINDVLLTKRLIKN